MLCNRQGGKSLAASAIALRTAFLNPSSLILIISRSQRQAGEFFKDKFKRLYNALNRPVESVQESQLSIEFANGSRVLCMPGNENSIQGYSSVNLLVIDEAARVSDALYDEVRPMIARSRGRIVALSTPFGKRGWFYEAWSELPVIGKADDNVWERYRVDVTECPHIPADFLAEERLKGERYYSERYMCSFNDCVGAVFAHDDISACLSGDVEPMFAMVDGGF
jgi:Terminase large subunit, T4likevirus-type, N-terminal